MKHWLAVFDVTYVGVKQRSQAHHHGEFLRHYYMKVSVQDSNHSGVATIFVHLSWVLNTWFIIQNNFSPTVNLPYQEPNAQQMSCVFWCIMSVRIDEVQPIPHSIA